MDETGGDREHAWPEVVCYCYDVALSFLVVRLLEFVGPVKEALLCHPMLVNGKLPAWNAPTAEQHRKSVKVPSASHPKSHTVPLQHPPQ